MRLCLIQSQKGVITLRTWSDAQIRAIEERNKAILVSAGAGSGKTSVLVERVITRVLGADQVDVDRILIVTFTEAAASEMRERIAQAFREMIDQNSYNERLSRQLYLLERATISTLHSFCMKAIRLAGLQLSIEPGFRVMESQEQMLLMQATLDYVLEQNFAAGNEAFEQFALRYGGTRGEQAIRDMVLELFHFAQSQPLPELWLDEALQHFVDASQQALSDSLLGQAFFEALADRIEQSASFMQEAVAKAEHIAGPVRWIPTLLKERDALVAAFEAAKARDYQAICQAMSFEFGRMPADKECDIVRKEQITELRDRVKRDMKVLKSGLLERSSQTLCDELKQVLPWVTSLITLVKDFSRAFLDEKQRRAVVDFADLEHLAYQALCGEFGVRSSLANQLSEQFIEVMVDEYQDTSPVQDAILSLLCKEDNSNLFQVGDIKQSIYRFRMAEPQLFLNKYTQYQIGDKAVTISLQQNYRSRESIIHAVNDVFHHLFIPVLGGLVYDEQAFMLPGAQYPDAPNSMNTFKGPVEMVVLSQHDLVNEDQAQDIERDEDLLDAVAERVPLTIMEREARFIGERILQMKEAHQNVFDARNGVYREMRYDDVVVLLRSALHRTEVIVRVLRQMGIPCQGANHEGFFTGLEVRLAISLCQIIDNPMQDIALAAILRSPIGDFTSTDLANIRVNSQGTFYDALLGYGSSAQINHVLAQKVLIFLAKLEHWRTVARTQHVGDAVSFVIKDSGLDGFSLSLPSGAQRSAHLDAFLSLAKAYDGIEQDAFAGFVRYLEEHEIQQTALAIKDDGVTGLAVRVMTIHKSKGLEFPIVFLANLGSKFQLPTTKSLFSLHRTLGLGPQFVDYERRQRYDTITSFGIRQSERREMLAEEARILYVGMTRARECLIMVGSVADAHKAIAHHQEVIHGKESVASLSNAVILRATSFLDWLLPIVTRSCNVNDLYHLVTQEDREPALDSSVSLSQQVADDDVSWQEISQLLPNALPPLLPEQETMRQVWRDTLLKYVYDGDANWFAIPAKMSVTEWKKRTSTWQTQDDSFSSSPLVTESRTPLRRPKFVQQAQGLSATEKGTAMHKVLQLLSLDAHLVKENYVIQKLEQLVLDDRITMDECKAVSVQSIASFFQTPLGQLLLKDPSEVRREVSFTMALAPDGVRDHLITKRSKDRNAAVIVQGTVDCLIFGEHGILLLDYKTDRVHRSSREAAQQYVSQMAMYKIALERSFLRPVSEVWLYFTETSEAVQLTDEELAIL